MDDRIARLREMIADAWSEMQVPPPERLIRSQDTVKAQAEAEQLRTRIAGRPWNSFSLQDVEGLTSASVYLSSEGFAYYLPLFLLRGLDDHEGRGSLAFSVVFSVLTPSYWELYFNGQDTEFEERARALSPNQCRVVCSFLEMFFDCCPEMRFDAAEALRWGWNLPGTPAHDKAKEFYYSMQNYHYPVPGEGEIRDLIALIREAFDKTPPPDPERMIDSVQGEEEPEIGLEFRGLDWRTLHPEFLSYHYSSLTFLSDSGFRYFLPAYLIADLMGTDMNTYPVSDLTHHAYDSHGKKRYASFSTEERTAIIRYLEYSMRDEYDAPKIRQALERYWYPSLQHSDKGNG